MPWRVECAQAIEKEMAVAPWVGAFFSGISDLDWMTYSYRATVIGICMSEHPCNPGRKKTGEDPSCLVIYKT